MLAVEIIEPRILFNWHVLYINRIKPIAALYLVNVQGAKTSVKKYQNQPIQH